MIGNEYSGWWWSSSAILGISIIERSGHHFESTRLRLRHDHCVNVILLNKNIEWKVCQNDWTLHIQNPAHKPWNLHSIQIYADSEMRVLAGLHSFVSLSKSFVFNAWQLKSSFSYLVSRLEEFCHMGRWISLTCIGLERYPSTNLCSPWPYIHASEKSPDGIPGVIIVIKQKLIQAKALHVCHNAMFHNEQFTCAWWLLDTFNSLEFA